MAEEALRLLAERVLRACAGREGSPPLTIATAESCTGGLVADALTDIPGSSVTMIGGLVAYSDRVKHDELGVPAETLAGHGAVSAQVAMAMAAGARQRFGTHLAVAVTGVAGPGGGSESKPVGLTYLAIASPGGVEVERHTWTGDRWSNKRSSAEAALELLARAAEATRGER